MFSDQITRYIRTYVPILIGTLLANVPWLEGTFNTDALVAVAIAGYYLLASTLEKWKPVFGFLLGVPKVLATSTATGKAVNPPSISLASNTADLPK